MQEEKIVLDKKSFGALAVDSRVNILKALRKRRKTLTELSDELKLSPSATKEHLEKLVDAELIVRVEDGHKWKYYELTRKGGQLVSPSQAVRVMVLLGIAVIAFIYSVFIMSVPSPMVGVQMEKAAPNVTGVAVQDAGRNAQTFAANESAAPLAAPPDQTSATKTLVESPPATDLLPLAVAAVSGLVVLVCIAWFVKRRIY